MNNILLGAAGLDIYIQPTAITRPAIEIENAAVLYEDCRFQLTSFTNTPGCVVLPGQGILHNAFHLQTLGTQPLLLTRLGDRDARLFDKFFQANQICVLPNLVYAVGRSVSIEVIVEPSGEAHFAHWQAGVWADFRLYPQEEELLSQADHLHLVMVDEVIPEFLRISETGLLAKTRVSADLFDFPFTLAEFAQLAPHLDMAFIGWKGELHDPAVGAIREVARATRTMLVLTLGARGVQIFDASSEPAPRELFFPVEPVCVTANTNGCGDAFISYFLAAYWQHRDLAHAVEQGKIGGAAATAWRYALPDHAYRDK